MKKPYKPPFEVRKPKFGSIILQSKGGTPWYAKGEYIIIDANGELVISDWPEVYPLKSAADKQCAYLNTKDKRISQSTATQ